MYSIVETGGFQYKVELGKAYKVPTLDAAVGSELELKSVLLFAGKEVQIGTPVLNDASVKVVRHRHRFQEEASHPLRTP